MGTNVSCKAVQLSIGPVSFRGGKCTDEKGQNYNDLAVGIGAGGGVYYLKGKSNREQFEFEGRLDGGVIAAGQLATSGNRGGWGLGLGVAVGGQWLIPSGGSDQK